MPRLASMLALFFYLPLEGWAEASGFPLLIDKRGHFGRDRFDEVMMQLSRKKREWIAGLSQPTHSAQLGDPCSEPGDCKVSNSECVPTDNLYWNKQNFCVCVTGFHPSTGYCIADSGTENQVGLIKLDYNHHQATPITERSTSTSSSGSNEDTTKNTSVRSLLMTPAPGHSLLQGFHFGNKTQAIVSNLVEQLTHLRGQPQTDAVKEKIETLGLPLVQPLQAYRSEDAQETTTTAPAPALAPALAPAQAPANSPDSNGYYLEVVTAPMAYAAGTFISTGTSTTSAPPSPVTYPPITTTTTANLFANMNQNPNPLPPPRPPGAPRVQPAPAPSTATPVASAVGTAATPSPTMATIATLKSSGNTNNNPFLPPALPPFFTKPNQLRTVSTPTTYSSTTIAIFNVTTASAASAVPNAVPADDPEARLALLRKVQNLIIRTTSPMPPRPAATVEPSTPSLNQLVPVTVPTAAAGGNAASRSTAAAPSTTASTAATPSSASENVVTQPATPQAPFPNAQRPHPHQVHHPPNNAAGMKHLLNNFASGKGPPMALPAPSQSAGLPPQLLPQLVAQFAATHMPNIQQPTAAEFESQQQVRSTLIDRLPGVDFYAVFRSAAENVIREYLGGILTTTASPFPQMAAPQGMRDFDLGGGGGAAGAAEGAVVDTSIEKLLEKLVESKSGPGGLPLGLPQHGHAPHPHGFPHGLPPNLSLPPTTPRTNFESKPQSSLAPTPASAATTPTKNNSLGTPSTPTVTRPRHPFIWSSTSPGRGPGHALPRIVFTGR